MAESSVEAIAARLERGGRKSLEIFSALGSEEWQIQVYAAPEWTVRDLLAHLVSAGERLFELAQDVAAGGTGAPAGFVYDSFNAEEQTRLADHSPEALMAMAGATHQRTVDWAKAMDERQLARASRHPALGEVTLGEMLTAIYGHELMHMRDVASKLRERRSG